ncbi:MAG TPA: DUF4105 domain-containing protein [Thermoanaerobaculia bacterium]|jgi:hypothetical protein
MKKVAFTLLAAGVLAFVLLHVLVRPSNDRDWTVDNSRLPHAEFRGPLVTVRNVRNFSYETDSVYTPAWYGKTFDLRRLDSVWFIVEPFSEWDGPAHTFVSFGFGDEFVAISVEIRKEKAESFSPWRGLARQYELLYVVGDERDLVKLRSNYRKDDVYLYPVRTTPERMRRMFVDMLTRANAVAAKPEFYNTLTNTCTTNIVRHANTVVPERIPWSTAILLPGKSDRFAYDLGLIDTDVPVEALRKRYRINELAERYANDPRFSLRIRGR